MKAVIQKALSENNNLMFIAAKPGSQDLREEALDQLAEIISQRIEESTRVLKTVETAVKMEPVCPDLQFGVMYSAVAALSAASSLSAAKDLFIENLDLFIKHNKGGVVKP